MREKEAFFLQRAVDPRSLEKETIKGHILKCNFNLFHFKTALWVVYIECFKIIILMTFNLGDYAYVTICP